MSLVATASGHSGAVSSGRGVLSVVTRSSPVGMLSDPLVSPPCGVFCVADAARDRVGCKASSSPEGTAVSLSSAHLLRAVEVTRDRVVREAASPLGWVFGTTQCCGVALSHSLLSGVAAVRVDSSLLRMPGAVGSPCIGESAPFGRARVTFSRGARAFNLPLRNNFRGEDRPVQRVKSRLAAVFLDMVSPLKDVVAPVSRTVRWAGVSLRYHLRAVWHPGGVGVEVSPVAGVASVTLVLDSRSGKRLVNCFSPGFGALTTMCCELGFATPSASPTKGVPCSRSVASRYFATGSV